MTRYAAMMTVTTQVEAGVGGVGHYTDEECADGEAAVGLQPVDLR